MDAPTELSARHPLLGAAATAVLFAVTLVATSPGLPLAWDEGNAILRAEGIRQGDWQYTTRLEGHPAFYGIVIVVGQWLSPDSVEPLSAARLGPMMLFSLAAGALFYRMRRQYSVCAALGAVAALILMPRMFAHAHFASFDGPLVSCWILVWAAFEPARRRWPAAVLWGVLLGMTLSCKATGWIAPVPFLIWTAVYRDRAAARALLIGIPVALAIFFVLNPPLWQDPILGWGKFFDLNLNRAAHGWNIPIQFFGEMYHLGNPLPWYNTLAWTAVTVPVGILLLAVVGVVVVLRRCRTDRAGVLLLANWLVLLVVRAFPTVPPHDGVRLFLPSFAFLAALAGVGCAGVFDWAAHRWPQSRQSRRMATAAVVLLLAGNATSLFWYAPQWLSYYNLLIGGLPGAAAAGMEPTYYWDGLDRPVFDWLHVNTKLDEKIRFGACSAENLELLRRWNVLRRATQFDQRPGTFRWYVLQRRPSSLQPADVRLIEHAEPVYRKVIRPDGIGPWRLDVPLIEIYRHEDYARACRTEG